MCTFSRYLKFIRGVAVVVGTRVTFCVCFIKFLIFSFYARLLVIIGEIN